MNFMKRGIVLVSIITAALICTHVKAQVPTTTIADTVYYANGTPAQGTVIVSWSAFTTANGAAIAAGNTTVTLGAGGALNIALAPNVGSTPMGNFYTAVYHLNDGEASREYWVVPVVIPGGGPAKLAGIRNQVLPTSMAMQAVTKQYVDAEILAAEIAPLPLGSAPFVLKAGDTLIGPLVLPGDPASALQAADKSYVDATVTALTGIPTSAVGEFDWNLAGAAGTQRIAGLPFKPSSVTFHAVVQGTTSTSNGNDDGTSANAVYYNPVVSTSNIYGGKSIALYDGSFNNSTAKITALHSDGFTVTWSYVNMPTGTASVVFTAFK